MTAVLPRMPAAFSISASAYGLFRMFCRSTAEFVRSLFMALQTPHGFETMLLEDGSEVGLAYVVGEGAVAEDDGAFSSGLQCFVPGYEAEGQRLHVGLRDGGREADKQRAAANGVDFMRLFVVSGHLLPFDRHAEVEAEFE